MRPATAPSAAPFPAPFPAPFALGRPDLLLLVTGSARGRMEPCNCGREMAGGQSRKATAIRAYRALADHVVAIDTGDAFAPRQPDSVKNVFLARGLQRMGVDAAVLGEAEWAAPPGRLRAALGPGPTAWLSTTVSATLPGVALSPCFTSERAGVKIALLSDLRDLPPGSAPEGRSVLGLPALAARVDDLRRQGFLVVLAVHGDDARLAEAARACAADLFLQGHAAGRPSAFFRVAGRPAARVGGDEHLGVLALRVRDGRIAASEWRVEELDARWASDPELSANYGDYTQAAMKEMMDALLPDGLAYVPASDCRPCHVAQEESWRRTAHARAHATLKREFSADDPDCLRCHTTGFGTGGGFRSLATTPGLTDVQCQSCHAVDLPAHRDDGRAPPPITPATCLPCHTPERDPEFRYESRRAAARCAPDSR